MSHRQALIDIVAPINTLPDWIKKLYIRLIPLLVNFLNKGMPAYLVKNTAANYLLVMLEVHKHRIQLQ